MQRRRRFGFLIMRFLVWVVLFLAIGSGAFLLIKYHKFKEAKKAVSQAPAEPTPLPKPEGLGALLLDIMSGGGGGPAAPPGKPIPAGKEARTEKDVNREFTEWRIKQTLESYEKACAGKTSATQEIRQFLTDACRNRQWQEGAPTAEEMVKRGKALIDSGCREPQVQEAYAAMLTNNGDDQKAIEILEPAIDGMVKAKYPRLQIGLACGLHYRLELSVHQYTQKAVDLKIAALAALVQANQNGEVPSAEMHHVERVFRNLVEYNGYDQWIEAWELIRTTPGLDRWFRNVVEGEAKIKQAWQARGGGWAAEVTKEGWKGFGESLTQARALLTEAWKLRPDQPQAPTAMIAVVMGGCGAPGENERTWFDRAVAAQFDRAAAYNSFAWSLRPRWGGSVEEMMGLAQECLDTGRFDTDVPWRCLCLMREAAGELPMDAWRAVFRDPRVHEALVKLFEGYLKEAAEKKNVNLENHIRRQWAVAEAWCGNYEKAGEMLAKLPADDKLLTRYMDWAITWGGMDRKMVEAEIRAFTGPDKEVLAKGEEYLCGGNPKECVRLFTTALDTAKGDKDVYNYIRDRIAYIMMSDAKDLVGSPSFRGWAMQEAAKLEHEAALKFLIDHGGDVNVIGADDLTPLQGALRRGNGAMVQYLLDHGADPNVFEDGTYSPLSMAIQGRDPKLALLIIQKGADPNKISKIKYAPMNEAASLGFLNLVRAMLDKGANPNIQTPNGWTPLLSAVNKGQLEVARVLLERGADPNIPHPDSDYSPLHIAAFNGDVAMAKLLLEKGANREAKLKKGKSTPLELARKEKKDGVVQLLEAP